MAEPIARPPASSHLSGARARLAALLFQVGSWLSERRFVWLSILVALGLCLPSVFTGLKTEDYYHFSAIQGGGIEPFKRVNLFNYIDGNIAGTYGLKNFGTVPWFALENYKVSFWRPLASLTHWLDYHYFPSSPWVAHLQNLFWYGALVGAVGLIYRRILPAAWLAALATLFYAIDDAHAHPVGWLANRNAFMAAAFGALAIGLHDIWRRGNAAPLIRWLAAFGAPVCLGLALLSGEFGLGAAGYLAAHALWLDSVGARGEEPRAPYWRSLGVRVLVLLPGLAVSLVWMYWYRRLGHGTFGTDFHLDPLGDPRQFFLELVWRLPMLLFAQLFGVDSEVWWSIDSAWIYLPALLIALFLWLSLKYLLSAELARPEARFWLTGMVLSSVPACAALPQDRMLFFTGVGALALVVLAIGRFVAAAQGLQAELAAQAQAGVGQGDKISSGSVFQGRFAFGLIAVLALMHGVMAPATFVQRSLTMHRFGSEMDRVGERLMANHPNLNQHLVLLGGPSYFYVGSSLGLRATRRLSAPRHIRMLHAGRGPLTVTRSAEQQLILEAPKGFYTDPFDGTYRGRQHPMRVGEGLQLTGMLVIVRGIDEQGVPTRIEINLQLPVRDGHYRFVAWNAPKLENTRIAAFRDGFFGDIQLPAVGHSVQLSGRP